MPFGFGMRWSSASERRERSLRVLSYEEMDYERPYPMTEVDPRTEIYCSRCGINSKWKPAEKLTVTRHHHARHKDGHWMWY